MGKNQEDKTHISRTIVICLIISCFILPLIPFSIYTPVIAFAPPNNTYRDLADTWPAPGSVGQGDAANYTFNVSFENGYYYYYADGDTHNHQTISITNISITHVETYNGFSIGTFQIIIPGVYDVTWWRIAIGSGNWWKHSYTRIHDEYMPYFSEYFTVGDYYQTHFFKMYDITDLFVDNVTNRMIEMLPQANFHSLQSAASSVDYNTTWDETYVVGNIYQFIGSYSDSSYVTLTMETGEGITPFFIGTKGYFYVWGYLLGHLEGTPNYYDETQYINYTINNTLTNNVLYYMRFSVLSTHPFYYQTNTTLNGVGDNGYASWFGTSPTIPPFISTECEIVDIIVYPDTVFGLAMDNINFAYFVQTRNQIFRTYASSDIYFLVYNSPAYTTRNHNIMYTWDNMLWWGTADSIYMALPDFSDDGNKKVADSGNAMPFVHYSEFVTCPNDYYFVFSQTEGKLMRISHAAYDREWISISLFGEDYGYWQYYTVPTVIINWTNEDAGNPYTINDVTSNNINVYIAGTSVEPVEKQKIFCYNKKTGTKTGEIDILADCIYCINNNTMVIGNSTGLYLLDLTDNSIIYNDTTLSGGKQIISDFIDYIYVVRDRGGLVGEIDKIYFSNMTFYKKFGYEFPDASVGKIHDIKLSDTKNYFYAAYKNKVLKFQNYYSEEEEFNFTQPYEEWEDWWGPDSAPPGIIPGGSTFLFQQTIAGGLGLSYAMTGFLLCGILVLIIMFLAMILGLSSGFLYVFLAVSGTIMSYAFGFIPIWPIFLFGIVGAGLLVFGGMKGGGGGG